MRHLIANTFLLGFSPFPSSCPIISTLVLYPLSLSNRQLFQFPQLSSFSLSPVTGNRAVVKGGDKKSNSISPRGHYLVENTWCQNYQSWIGLQPHQGGNSPSHLYHNYRKLVHKLLNLKISISLCTLVLMAPISFLNSSFFFLSSCPEVLQVRKQDCRTRNRKKTREGTSRGERKKFPSSPPLLFCSRRSCEVLD